MKHRNGHLGGHDRHAFSPEGRQGSPGPRHHHGRGRGHGEGRTRLFDYGEIRHLVLSLIAEKPTYGYELIKTIEEKFGGSYTPSPGVIYPTLTWLEEAGYIRPTDESGRKSYCITDEGAEFLTSNPGVTESILARAAMTDHEGRGGRRNVPVPVMRAMENLKTALRLRLRNGSFDGDVEAKIAAILDNAASGIEQV